MALWVAWPDFVCIQRNCKCQMTAILHLWEQILKIGCGITFWNSFFIWNKRNLMNNLDFIFAHAWIYMKMLTLKRGASITKTYIAHSRLLRFRAFISREQINVYKLYLNRKIISRKYMAICSKRYRFTF